MDEYADIYWVDERNAGRDHRRTPTSGSGLPWRPAAPPVRTVYVPPPAQVAMQPTMQPAMYHQAPLVYQAPTAMQQPSVVSSLFGKLTAGQAVEIVAQIFAALQALPAAPTTTRNADTDAANHILYQTALAQHAKRDEQVRTIGALVAKLVG